MKRIIVLFYILFNLGIALVIHEINTYVINDKRVFWNQKEIEGVDIPTFSQLVFWNKFYAKDKNAIYYKGKIIEKADLETFEILRYSDYSKDKNSLYFKDKKVSGVDLETFEIIDWDYAKDKDSVYFQQKIINKADPVTFEPLDPFFSYYSKDKQYVYYQGELVRGADPGTLKKVELNAGNSRNIDFGSTYASDKNSVYFDGEKILGADPKTFEALSSDLSKDKNDFYYLGKKLNVDLKIFEYILEGSCFKGKDKNKTYEYGCGDKVR